VEDLSEKEQLEQMRAWWSEYGNYVIGGIVIGIGLMVGIGQFRSQNVRTQTEASALYETLFEAVADGKTNEAESVATDLYGNYASTIYSSQARLVMARHYMDKGRDQDAANALRAIVDADPDSELGLIARLRLAKVLLYQDKAQEVVELLSNAPESAFAARYSEALGDAYVALGQFADARDAYFQAMADSATMPTVDRVLVQMKVDDLPESGVMDTVTDELTDDAAPDAATEDEVANQGDGASG
jgi:predicted negative regulator of RcsB-dependent stress response